MGHSRPKWGVRTMSGLPPLATIERTYEEVRFVPILLQKSFWGGERKFLEPLMRFASGDVREPYRFIQNRSRTSVVALKSDAAAEKSKDQLSRDFPGRSIFDFATISALSGPRSDDHRRPLTNERRTSGGAADTSAFDRGGSRRPRRSEPMARTPAYESGVAQMRSATASARATFA
jgi:hypothetical protein